MICIIIDLKNLFVFWKFLLVLCLLFPFELYIVTRAISMLMSKYVFIFEVNVTSMGNLAIITVMKGIHCSMAYKPSKWFFKFYYFRYILYNNWCNTFIYRLNWLHLLKCYFHLKQSIKMIFLNFWFYYFRYIHLLYKKWCNTFIWKLNWLHLF